MPPGYSIGILYRVTSLDQDLSDLAIGRLDDLCNFFHKSSGISADGDWPMDLQLAADQLAGDLERLAGALDQANNNRAAVRELIDDAGRELPEAFAAFGSALAEDLAAALLRRQVRSSSTGSGGREERSDLL